MSLNLNPRTIYEPSFDLCEHFAFLRPRTRTAVLLRPIPAVVPDPFASKIGGTIAWPAAEPWPKCPHDGFLFVPVIQLRKNDFPELPWPVGKDIFQLLWCPFYEHPDIYFVPLPTTRWRHSEALTDILPEIPTMPKEPTSQHYPKECGLNPQRVIEHPVPPLITREQYNQVDQWVKENARADFENMNLPFDSPHASYGSQFSIATGTKIGGFESWVQEPQIPHCDKCSSPMQHMLTMHSREYGDFMAKRWQAYDEYNRQRDLDYSEGPGICVGDQYPFFAHVCMQCDDRPVKCGIFQ